jgi:hypothetical protein
LIREKEKTSNFAPAASLERERGRKVGWREKNREREREKERERRRRSTTDTATKFFAVVA